jgi:hypothetical protein
VIERTPGLARRHLYRWHPRHFAPLGTVERPDKSQVDLSMVLEVAFDNVHRSTRHRSGVAMFTASAGQPLPRTDTLETLERMMT